VSDRRLTADSRGAWIRERRVYSYGVNASDLFIVKALH